jgi:hypothetical protein
MNKVFLKTQRLCITAHYLKQKCEETLLRLGNPDGRAILYLKVVVLSNDTSHHSPNIGCCLVDIVTSFTVAVDDGNKPQYPVFQLVL